jgi:hypothetical protein
MKIHWVGVPSENSQKLIAIPSLRLRYGVAKNIPNIDISIGANISKDVSAVIFGKATWNTNNEKLLNNYINIAKRLKELNIKIIIDYTDNYLNEEYKNISHLSKNYQNKNQEVILKTKKYYKNMIEISDALITSSESMKKEISEYVRQKIVISIPDAIDDYGLINKSLNQSQCLWFGMPMSFPFLLDAIAKIDLMIKEEITINCLTDASVIINAIKLKNITIPKTKKIKLKIVQWSIDNIIKYNKESKFTLIPSDINDGRKKYASSNRLITAFALKRPVIATVIPSYEEYRDLFIDINTKQCDEYFINYDWDHEKIESSQKISMEYSPEKIKLEWRKAFYEIIG